MANLTDLRVVLHDKLPDSYELSKVLLAKADVDGTLQLLTSAWERLLGYGPEEFKGKTLLHFMWCNPRSAAAAASALLDQHDMGPVRLRLRCRDGRGMSFTLHRLYDKDERMMYVVAEEAPRRGMHPSGAARPAGEERRDVVRMPGPP